MSVERIRPAVATAPIEAQQLRVLIDALGLKPGQTVEARVAAMLGDDLAQLVIGSSTLDVKTPQPLPVGATLTMTVERQGQALRLLLSDNPAAPRAPIPAQPTAAQPPAGAAGGALPMAAPGLATPIAPANAVAAALVDLVARGLVAAGTAKAVDGAQVAIAVRGSQDASRAVEINAAGRAQPATPREALAEAVRGAADRQESLSPLFADLAAVANGGTPAAARAIPEPVLRAMAEVLGFRLRADGAASPQALARAIDQSGTFLEARLAALPSGSAVPADLKAALGQLRAALAEWTAALGEEPSAGNLKASVHERPPVRGALPHGQPPSPASLGAEASASDVARVLTERTEAALARMTLLQAASLPEARDIGRPDAPLQTVVEVPLRIGAETAILQFQIVRERDPEAQARGGAAAHRQDWIMRFSMEAEPLGPVHAAVRWRDGHVGVQLWAERDGIAATLDAARDHLSDALEASAFTVDQLTIAAGRPADPREAAGPRGPRLDRLS